MYEERLLVDHLRLQLSPGVPLRERGQWGRRAASALGAAELTPQGLPPQATLVVRRLSDPRPGVLLDQNIPPWQAGSRWGSAAREAVGACWRHAARPLRGPVPAQAPAVWFADRAEWLACLSVDLYYGLAIQRWWWRAWLTRERRNIQGAPGDSLALLWGQEARWVPSALALLAAEMPGSGAALVGGVSPAGRKRVRAALAQAYSLPSSLADEPVSVAQGERDVTEWSGYIPGGPEALPREPGAGHLLTLALALYHAPAAVGAGRMRHGKDRSPRETPASYWAKPAEPASASPIGGRGREPDAASGPADRPSDGLLMSEQGVSGAVSIPAVASARPLAPHTSEAGATASGPGKAAADADGPAQARAGTVAFGAAATVAAAGKPTTASQEVGSLAAEALEVGLQTSLGGVFYLINVLVELDLLAKDGSGPGPWERLALLAQAFLSSRAVSQYLAWRRGYGRTWHPNQLAHNGDPLWGALAVLAGLELDQAATARHWLADHLPPITHRLAQAVPGGERPDIAKKLYRSSRQRATWRKIAALLRQPAVFYITRTHIDVFFSLERIDIAVRRAGLDRDPGWVPELGRVVTLHFE